MIQPTNNIFDALTDEKRRRLLFGLLEENPQPNPPVVKDSPPDASRIEYQHIHLPKLANYGFIEWSPSKSHIEKGPQFEEIQPVLELLSESHKNLPTEP
jgi:hypothetical protein